VQIYQSLYGKEKAKEEAAWSKTMGKRQMTKGIRLENQKKMKNRKGGRLKREGVSGGIREEKLIAPTCRE